MAIEITDQNFDEMVNGNPKPIILDFWAEWCAPCIKIGESINELAMEYKSQAFVGKVNVDSNSSLAFKYGIRNMPTIIYLKDGKVIDRQVGVVSKAVLEEKLKAIL